MFATLGGPVSIQRILCSSEIRHPQPLFTPDARNRACRRFIFFPPRGRFLRSQFQRPLLALCAPVHFRLLFLIIFLPRTSHDSSRARLNGFSFIEWKKVSSSHVARERV